MLLFDAIAKQKVRPHRAKVFLCLFIVHMKWYVGIIIIELQSHTGIVEGNFGFDIRWYQPFSAKIFGALEAKLLGRNGVIVTVIYIAYVSDFILDIARVVKMSFLVSFH